MAVIRSSNWIMAAVKAVALAAIRSSSWIMAAVLAAALAAIRSSNWIMAAVLAPVCSTKWVIAVVCAAVRSSSCATTTANRPSSVAIAIIPSEKRPSGIAQEPAGRAGVSAPIWMSLPSL